LKLDENNMALNPLRDELTRAGLRAFGQSSGFQAETGAALDRFRALRRELEMAVRKGDMTPKVARERAAAAARDLANDLRARSRSHASVPRVFRDRLRKAAEDRKVAREAQSLEGLQRETNRLLRQVLIEQQIAQRAAEFEGRAFVKATPTSQPLPTLDGLLAFHAWSTQAGDEAAREWARRQLETMRAIVFNPEDHRRIDLACDRPDQVNPRLIATYVEAMKDQPADQLEAFVAHAVAERDANACIAAFSLAREAPEGAYAAWVRKVLDGLREFPDVALNALCVLEADAQASDQEAALAHAEQAAATAEAEARLAGLAAPTAADLARDSRVDRLPVAGPDEPIGLALTRRWPSPKEHAANQARTAEEVPSDPHA
jgi:hypothetical protein